MDYSNFCAGALVIISTFMTILSMRERNRRMDDIEKMLVIRRMAHGRRKTVMNSLIQPNREWHKEDESEKDFNYNNLRH